MQRAMLPDGTQRNGTTKPAAPSYAGYGNHCGNLNYPAAYTSMAEEGGQPSPLHNSTEEAPRPHASASPLARTYNGPSPQRLQLPVSPQVMTGQPGSPLAYKVSPVTLEAQHAGMATMMAGGYFLNGFQGSASPYRSLGPTHSNAPDGSPLVSPMEASGQRQSSDGSSSGSQRARRSFKSPPNTGDGFEPDPLGERRVQSTMVLDAGPGFLGPRQMSSPALGSAAPRAMQPGATTMYTASAAGGVVTQQRSTIPSRVIPGHHSVPMMALPESRRRYTEPTGAQTVNTSGGSSPLAPRQPSENTSLMLNRAPDGVGDGAVLKPSATRPTSAPGKPIATDSGNIAGVTHPYAHRQQPSTPHPPPPESSLGFSSSPSDHMHQHQIQPPRRRELSTDTSERFRSPVSAASSRDAAPQRRTSAMYGVIDLTHGRGETASPVVAVRASVNGVAAAARGIAVSQQPQQQGTDNPDKNRASGTSAAATTAHPAVVAVSKNNNAAGRARYTSHPPSDSMVTPSQNQISTAETATATTVTSSPSHTTSMNSTITSSSSYTSRTESSTQAAHAGSPRPATVESPHDRWERAQRRQRQACAVAAAEVRTPAKASATDDAAQPVRRPEVHAAAFTAQSPPPLDNPLNTSAQDTGNGGVSGSSDGGSRSVNSARSSAHRPSPPPRQQRHRLTSDTVLPVAALDVRGAACVHHYRDTNDGDGSIDDHDDEEESDEGYGSAVSGEGTESRSSEEAPPSTNQLGITHPASPISGKAAPVTVRAPMHITSAAAANAAAAAKLNRKLGLSQTTGGAGGGGGEMVGRVAAPPQQRANLPTLAQQPQRAPPPTTQPQGVSSTSSSAGVTTRAVSSSASTTTAKSTSTCPHVVGGYTCRAQLQRYIDQWRDRFEEDQNAYKEGGYLTVTPGKVVHARYVLIQKLGWGEFSTVWLAYDTKHASLGCGVEQAFVAVKVAKCRSSVQEATEYEVSLLRYIEARLPPQASVTNIIDCFGVRGEFGVHSCMAMPLCGPNLLSIIDRMKAQSGRRCAEDVRLIKEVLVSVLISLHELSVLNVIHTDIKPENVLCCAVDTKLLGSMERFCSYNKDRTNMISVEEFHESVAQQSTNHLVCLADFGLSALLEPPAEAVVSVAQCRSVDQAQLAPLLRCKKNFSVSRSGVMDNLRGTLIQTREYRAPEVILGLDFTPTTDIWSVGCMAFELITGMFLMDPKKKTQDTREMDIEHLAMMMQLLGPMPAEITKLRVRNNAYYDAATQGVLAPRRNTRTPPEYLHRFVDREGNFIYASRYRAYPRRSLEFELEPSLGFREARLAGNFIMSCLGSYDPQSRPSAKKLLSHPWLHGVTSSASGREKTLTR